MNFEFTPSELNVWKTTSIAQCGLGSIHVLVQRSMYPDIYGFYVYDIYFATNSYFPNCLPSNSYVSNIEVLYSDLALRKFYYPLNFYQFWVIIGQTQLVYKLYHQNPYLIIKVKADKIQPSIM